MVSGLDPSHHSSIDAAASEGPDRTSAPKAPPQLDVAGSTDTFQASKAKREENPQLEDTTKADLPKATGLRAALSRWLQSFLSFIGMKSQAVSGPAKGASSEANLDNAIAKGMNDQEFGIPNSTSQAYEELDGALRRFVAEGNPVVDEKTIGSLVPNFRDPNAMGKTQTAARDKQINRFLQGTDGKRFKQVAELLLSLPDTTKAQRDTLAARLAPSLTGNADSKAGDLLSYVMDNPKKFNLSQAS